MLTHLGAKNKSPSEYWNGLAICSCEIRWNCCKKQKATCLHWNTFHACHVKMKTDRFHPNNMITHDSSTVFLWPKRMCCPWPRGNIQREDKKTWQAWGFWLLGKLIVCNAWELGPWPNSHTPNPKTLNPVWATRVFCGYFYLNHPSVCSGETAGQAVKQPWSFTGNVDFVIPAPTVLSGSWPIMGL